MTSANTRPNIKFRLTSLTSAMLLSCAIVLSSCGGREAHPIAATNVTDSSLNCGAISREFEANERRITATIKERSQAQGKNVILGATGVLLFFPALFFMDPKSPEKVEIDALRSRNTVLAELAQSEKCPAPKSQLTDVYKQLDGKGPAKTTDPQR